MRTCEAKSEDRSGRVVTCTLPVGHGGVHAERVLRERKEASTVGQQIREDYPTTIYETVCTWSDGGPAAPHSVQR